MEIFFANAPFAATQDQLMLLFGEFGTVESMHLVCDRETQQSKGYGFVLMPHDREALLAIQQLDKRDVDGRRLAVRPANERQAAVEK